MWIDQPYQNRRNFLANTAFGVGASWLWRTCSRGGSARQSRPASPARTCRCLSCARPPHFAPKATAMISLFMHGGPSHVDLFDPKPELTRAHGTEYGGDVVFSFVNRASKKLFASPWKFAKHGQCGTEVSELLPADGRDRGRPLRDPLDAHRAQRPRGLHPVFPRWHPGDHRPADAWAVGSSTAWAASRTSCRRTWCSPTRAGTPVDGANNWSSGFMPPLYQGTVLRPRSRGSSTSTRPPCSRRDVQRQNLAFLDRLNHRHLERHPGRVRPGGPHPRATSWPRPCRPRPRRRSTSPSEPEYIRRLYGLDHEETREYGTRCLIARRLVERGVRFVQLFLGGQPVGQPQHHPSGPPGDLPANRSAGRRPGARTSSSAGCSTRRSSTGAARSAGCRSARGTSTPAPVATTTAKGSPSGWPAAASRAG